MVRQLFAIAAVTLTFLGVVSATQNSSSSSSTTSIESLRAQLALMDDRPPECPPCFNCLLPAFSCGQYANCNSQNGQCSCPPGFGGTTCLDPLCGALSTPNDKRPVRDGTSCTCDEGWEGNNCNVCKEDKVCDALMPDGKGGRCNRRGNLIKENYQMCDVTNEKIRDLLGEQVPQVTFTCNKDDATCDFQFWVDQRESFYCHLDECSSSFNFDSASENKTYYNCDKVECSCIADRMLCGENGSVDITDFLDEEIRGPGSFECSQVDGGASKCAFKEPAMNDLISQMFGDRSITISCNSGECVHFSELPDYKREVPRINTPLIAGIIAGCALFLVAVIVLTWYLSRRSFKYGPIHLDDSDDEALRLMADHKPASVQFENVAYTLNGKQILSGLRGIARSGEVTAIMGASGAGKTTFLDILARKNKRGEVSGDFFVNGEKVDDTAYKSFVGFVDQEDTMLATLTVHETILNSALLRLPRDMSTAAKEQKVFEVEKQLGIFHIKDSLIGSEEGKGRGISGGEKRRVGIACELVTSPSILFLDEPTSGLDAYNAFNVVECLVTLAKDFKRTVIFTIHQPRSNIVALFDRLILLAQGKTVYSGPFTQCQEYFDHIGYPCPPGFNIADFLVDLTMHASTNTSFDPGSPARGSAPSSTKGVKSITSAIDIADESGVESSTATTARPRPKRKDSVKTRLERELFTRRKTDVDATAGNGTTIVQRLSSIVSSRNTSGQRSPQQDASSSDLDILVSSFAESDIAGNTHDEIEQATSTARNANGQNTNGNGVRTPNGQSSGMGKGYARIGYWRQFIILSQRTWKNLYRNPLLMLTHYAIAILLGVLSGFLFYGLTEDIPGFQNRLGLFFFVLALFGFSTLTSLNVFSSERLLFTRERANGYYSPVTYFAAKVLFDIIPLRIIPPILMGIIIYPMTGLRPDASHFFVFILVLVLFNLAAAGICLFIGIVCKDNSVANLIGSLVMLFSLLFAGLLLNQDKIPEGAKWLQWLSIFHYAFESLIVNEVSKLTLVDKKYGLDITVPGAAILSSFGFNNGAMWRDIVCLGGYGAVFIVFAYGAMHVLLVEKR